MTTDMLGITESEASFHRSLSSIGKSDKDGHTIAISYVTGTALRFIPLIIRLAIFLALFGLMFYRQPLQVLLWDFPLAPEWYTNLRNWEAFTPIQWVLTMVIYALYFFYALVKNGLYRGVPGAEIHFSRYGKIVYTVKPGQKQFVFDPRVRPLAVVSTRIMTAMMPPVDNNTRDNMSLHFNGTLVYRVKDTYKLLQAGGFKNFFRQLVDLHASLMKDDIQRGDAQHFNRFYVEPVELPAGHVGSSTTVVDRLGRLSSNTDTLSVDMLEGLAGIDEINVSRLGLGEPLEPARRKIMPALQRLADTYGVTIIDHLPGGNLTSDDYLHTLALPLVSGIMRLKQATDILKSMTENVIDVDIQNQVASRQMLVLEIGKIVKSVESVTKSLASETNRENLAESRKQTMENTSQSILTAQLAQIEGLLAQVKGSGVDLAGAELLVRAMEDALREIGEAIERSLPTIETVIVDTLDENAVVPAIDVVKVFFERSGFDAVITRLEATRSNVADPTEAFTTLINQIKVDETLVKIEKELDGVSASTGLPTNQWTPERVEEMIEAAEKKAADNQAHKTPTTTTTAVAVV